MGQAFRKLLGVAKREVMNYNVENRAFKEMDKQVQSPVGKAAPKHVTTSKKIEELEKEFPELKDEVKKKDERLVGWMQQMSLSRTDQDTEAKPESSTQQLSREQRVEPEFGFEQPQVIPEGKCTIDQALEFIYKRQQSSDYSIDTIAKEYRLNHQDVDDILKHFRAFQLFVPKKYADAIPEAKYSQPPQVKHIPDSKKDKLS